MTATRAAPATKVRGALLDAAVGTSMDAAFRGNELIGSRFKMRVSIAGHTFEGLDDINRVDVPEDHAAIFLIIGASAADQRSVRYYVLDVGESEQPGRVLARHDRRTQWQRASTGVLYALTCLLPTTTRTSREERRALVDCIRRETLPIIDNGTAV